MIGGVDAENSADIRGPACAPIHLAVIATHTRGCDAQTITRLVGRSVAFRYRGPMTVPGKGGRPRKWRSDADRVRAYRARQRGDEQPATFEAALADGDELARAVERSRQLQAELVEAIESLAEIDAALQTERRHHLATQRKLDRARADLDGYRATIDRHRDELQAARDEVDAFRAELAALQNADVHRPATGLNRPARREAAKRDRRGH